MLKRLRAAALLSTSLAALLAAVLATKAASANDGRVLTFTDQVVKRDFVVPAGEALTIRLVNSTLVGKISGATLLMDSTSHWDVTSDSALVGAGFDYHDFDHILGNGHTVLYNSEVPASSELREWTEELPGPSLLMPIMPALVAAAITSPHYVDGAAPNYAGPTHITSDINVGADSNPLDNSAIYATNNAKVIFAGTVTAPLTIDHTSKTKVIYPSGRDRTQDALMKYGVSAIVYANAGGEIDLDHFDVRGDTNGFYAVYGGVVRATNGKLLTTRIHGVQVCYGGKIFLDHVDIETIGPQGSGLSSDHGGGMVDADHVTVLTHVAGSAGIYADGFSNMIVRNSAIKSIVAPGAVISGAGHIHMTGSTLESVKGAILYVHPHGNNPFKRGIAFFDNAKLVGQNTAFLLTGMSVDIVVRNGTTVSIPKGQKLITATSPEPGALTLDRARELLPNDSSFTAQKEDLSGDIVVGDSRTKLTLHLTDGTNYSGAIDGAALTLDDSSHWTMTGNSTLTSFTGDRSHIATNGFTLTIPSPAPKGRSGPGPGPTPITKP